ncbi:DUF11 domain-containing protein [Neptunicoccus sediminis]|uniref:DUF11 domain-containing protein n=1 Tax=Neptunicoccus sediminis TaxID=1892596 RepID=UPI000845CF25|nr:DUF11 domain-containing protein [Neptunicoccus sediminis]
MLCSAFKKITKSCRALILGTALGLSVSGPAVSEIAPGGSIIRNIASATYFHRGLGISETVRSNPVEALVREVPALEITGLTDLRLSRGAFAEHAYEITNTGNVDLVYSAWIKNAEKTLMLTDTGLFIDANGNGVIDAGEREILKGDTLPIATSETVKLIYRFRVSATARLDDSEVSSLRISAASASSGESVKAEGEALGKVIIVDQALQLRKKLARRDAPEGEIATFTLALRNNAESIVTAYSALDGQSIFLDGVSFRGIVLRDAIPLNTTLLSATPAGKMVVGYHLRGQGKHSYQTGMPEDLSTVDAVAFLHDGDYGIGHSTDVSFDVLISDHLGPVSVENTALTYMVVDGVPTEIPSNTVSFDRVSDVTSTLEFIDPDTDTPAKTSDLDRDTRLMLTSGACNTSATVDVVTIEVTSTITNDMETVTATETGANTGIFTTTLLPIAQMSFPKSGDGVIASAPGDNLQARAECREQTVFDTLLVRPGSYVFNSLTNETISNATVQLLNRAGKVVAEAISDSSGFFALGDISKGRYTTRVLPPADFAFASKRTDFRGYARNVDAKASYGTRFRHGGGPVFPMDIPLDPFYGVPLSIEKSANKRQAQTGDFVTYTVRAQNGMNQALTQAIVVDALPRGAVYVEGTALVDGVAIDQPTVEATGAHRFSLGTIPPLETVGLTYVLRFTPSARSGDRVNSAYLIGQQAGSGEPRRSNTAQATVALDTSNGVFSRKATIIGSVFMDCNGNGVRDSADELGVAGVRIITQEGLMVVTDADGKYSLFGLRPVSHVLALQNSTLPDNSKPVVSRVADMGQAGSRLVALKRGEIRSEDFPLEACTADVMDEVSARRDTLRNTDSEGLRSFTELPVDISSNTPQSVRSEAGLATSTQIVGGIRIEDSALAPAGEDEALSETKKTLEDVIKSLSPAIGFMGLSDQERLTRRTLSLRVKGPADLGLDLIVNGQKIGSSRIGERSTWAGGNVQAIEYVAVKLVSGENLLQLIGKDPFGNIRKSAEIRVFAPGNAEKIKLLGPKAASASPTERVKFTVQILDMKGEPVKAATVVTLNARRGIWDVKDIRANQPGVQIYVDSGIAEINLIPPQSAGPDLLSAQSGTLGRAEASILFSPNLDERILVGVLEGTISDQSGAQLLNKGEFSAFEDTNTGLRGEIFLKGRVGRETLMTLRYSSDSDEDDRLFRDINTDESYPVYGDESERGYDGQSSSDLYVSFERGASSVVYGDIAIEPGASAFELGGFRTVTTGVKASWQGERTRVTAFAARTSQEIRTLEIAGRGVSGPYDVDLTGYQEGSDQVDVIVRDRDTGVILSETRLRRMSDYLLDFFLNTIVFDTPLRQADALGNPVSFRITYNVEGSGGEKYWLYGVEAISELNDRLAIGARAIHSDGAAGTEERYKIYSAFLQNKISDKATFEAEVAQAEDGFGRRGYAGRIAYDYVSDDTRFRFEAARTSLKFAPLGSNVRAGMAQISLDYEKRLSDSRTLVASADYQSDFSTKQETLGAEILVRGVVDETLTRASGFRMVVEKSPADKRSTTYFKDEAVWRPVSTPGMVLKFVNEVPLTGEDQGKFIVAADYRVRDDLRVFGEFELSYGDLGDKLTRAHIGVEYRVNHWLDGRTEVTANPGDLGDDLLVQGFSTRLELNERTSVDMSLEHSLNLSDPDSGLTSIALGGSWESRDGNWVAEANLDQTFEKTGNTFYADVGLAGEISPGVTLLARGRHARDGRAGQNARIRERLRVGAAYRPLDDARFKALGWYEYKRDRDINEETQHLWSLAGTWDMQPDLRVNGKYAGQYSNLSAPLGGIETASLTQLLQAGVTWDALPEKLELTGNVYHMWDDDGFAAQAYGIEAGYVFAKGAMLSVGYNHATEQLPFQSRHFQKGLYLRLRLKLTENLWDQLDNFLSQ